jgi:hypothetical protein
MNFRAYVAEAVKLLERHPEYGELPVVTLATDEDYDEKSAGPSLERDTSYRAERGWKKGKVIHV